MKTTKTVTSLTILIATLVCSSAIAEYQIWTDTNGKFIEAEQMKVLNSQVLLRLTDGREIMVSLDTLREEDRQRAILAQPPTLEINVSAKTSRSNSSAGTSRRRRRVQIEEESTQVTVSILKQSSAPYDQQLKAVLYLMGELDGNKHEIIDTVTETFTYAPKSKEFALTSGMFESQKRENGERRTEYAGWFVAVFDSNDQLIAMKSSKREYTENAENLLVAAPGISLDDNFEPHRLLAKRSTF